MGLDRRIVGLEEGGRYVDRGDVPGVVLVLVADTGIIAVLVLLGQDRIAVSITEHDAGTVASRSALHGLHNVGWHGQPVDPVAIVSADHAPAIDAVEMEASLGVAGGAGGQGTSSPWAIALVGGLTCRDLHICAERKSTVAHVDEAPGDYFAGAVAVRDPIRHDECIPPERGGIHHFQHESLRDAAEWEGRLDCSDALLHGADEALNLWHMFMGSGGVEFGSGKLDISAEALKLLVHAQLGDDESAGLVSAEDGADAGPEGLLLSVGDGLGGCKSDLVGYADEEGDAVDIHDVRCDDDTLVLFEQGWRDRNGIRLDGRRGGSGALALESADIDSEDGPGIVDVLHRNRTVWDEPLADELLEVGLAGPVDGDVELSGGLGFLDVSLGVLFHIVGNGADQRHSIVEA